MIQTEVLEKNIQSPDNIEIDGNKTQKIAIEPSEVKTGQGLTRTNKK